MIRKSLFLLFASFFTICFSCTEPLAADDFVFPTDLDKSSLFETILPVIDPLITANPLVLETASVTVEPTASVQAPTAVPVAQPAITSLNSLNLGGLQINLNHVNSTDLDAGTAANKVGKLIYGHNSASVFATLSSLTIGSTFTATENGITTTYQVAAIVVYEKNPDGRLQLNGRGSYMKALRDRASYNEQPHSLALMTCTGALYGNGDASHRLVVFADAI